MISDSKENLRWGFTTGSCAAAAARAALNYLLQGETVDLIDLTLPDGEIYHLPVASLEGLNNRAIAGVIKNAGDDPDVTDGLEIKAEVELLRGGEEIIIEGGEGVGTVTKPGLSVPPGEPAINPFPRRMIQDAVKELMPPGSGLKVIVKVPGGEEVASRTFNPRLGIEGGISILGTSGLVRPMSREAYLESLIPQIDQALSLGYKELLLTPGGKGVSRACEMGLPLEQTIQISNYVGDMLDACIKRKVQKVVLFGYLGKFIKVAAGVFNTHSSVADARRETLAAHAAISGAPHEALLRIMELNTMEEAVSVLNEYGLESLPYVLAREVSRQCEQRLSGQLSVGTIFYTLQGDLWGWDRNAEIIGGNWKWRQQLKWWE